MEDGLKIRYEVDPHNRLIVKKTAAESRLLRFRQVLDGKFQLGENNCLIYHLKKSSGIDIPQQIKLTGNFSLDQNHNLVFTLDKWNNQAEGNRLIIKTDIIDIKGNELSFAVITKNSSGRDQVYILRTTGSWQADDHNRLTFNIERERGNADRLTLSGSWEVNQKNLISYSYTRTETLLRRQKKTTRAIVFKGYWDIGEKNRLTYVLNKELGSQFDFKVGLGNYFRQTLVYEIGIGIVHKKKIIALSGAWKVNERLGVLFEIEYGNKHLHSIVFGASCKIGKDYNIDLRLKNRRNEDLGFEVSLSRDMFRDQGEAFIKALSSRKETAIVAGIGFRW